MKVLITGGAGFIGAHLANQLHQRGHYVRVLDDLSSGDPANLLPGINFNRGDVRDIPKLWSLLPPGCACQCAGFDPLSARVQ
jgi:UDP-glucose 4-epimerase